MACQTDKEETDKKLLNEIRSIYICFLNKAKFSQMNQNIKTYLLTIKGRVQNVGFRYWFYREAINLNLKGYVKNLNNGNEVESLVQGHSSKIIDIIKKSKKGPKPALVEEVISTQIMNNEIYTNFIIK